MNVYLKKQNFLFRNILIKIIIVIGIISFLNIFHTSARNALDAVSTPFSGILWRSGQTMSGALSSFANIKKLQSQAAALQAENQKLLSEISTLRQSVLEQQEYRTATAYHPSLRAAKVIGLDIIRDTAVINKGSADGIVERMPVVSAHNVLYGKVMKVYENTALIMLVSHKDNVVDVKVVNSAADAPIVYGAVKGLGNLGFFLDLIDSNTRIENGQTLATSGLDGTFPAGILVGAIAQVDHSDLKPFQTARLKPFHSPQAIENIFIITKGT